MADKGDWNGECVTVGCTNDARFILIAVPSREPDYLRKYRCTECCDLVINAIGEPMCGYADTTTQEYQEWDANARRVLTFDKVTLQTTQPWG